jgi:hypothetical protein
MESTITVCAEKSDGIFVTFLIIIYILYKDKEKGGSSNNFT